MKKYWRVWMGYDKFHSVSEDEIKKVIRAKMENAVTFTKSGMIDGKYISDIEPDKHKMLGVNPDYKLTGEDMRDIPRALLQEHEDFWQKTIAEINEGNFELDSGNKKLNGKSN